MKHSTEPVIQYISNEKSDNQSIVCFTFWMLHTKTDTETLI